MPTENWFLDDPVDWEKVRLRAAVMRAAKVFQDYGALHAAKPDLVKAKANYDLAEEMLMAL